MTTLPRHRTGRERRAQASAQQAIARALAHVPPPAPADPDPWGDAWPPSDRAWRLRCIQIREELDAERSTR